MKNYLVIDIETVSNDIQDEFILGQFKKHWEKLKERYSEEKIKEIIKSDMNIHPALAKIICCCIKAQDTVDTIVGEEKKILNQFWQTIELCEKEYPGFQFVSWNGIAFDCPFLEMRSKILGIKHFELPKKRWDISKHFDIRMVIGNWDNYFFGKLEFWAHVYGIEFDHSIIDEDIEEFYKK